MFFTLPLLLTEKPHLSGRNYRLISAIPEIGSSVRIHSAIADRDFVQMLEGASPRSIVAANSCRLSCSTSRPDAHDPQVCAALLSASASVSRRHSWRCGMARRGFAGWTAHPCHPSTRARCDRNALRSASVHAHSPRIAARRGSTSAHGDEPTRLGEPDSRCPSPLAPSLWSKAGRPLSPSISTTRTLPVRDEGVRLRPPSTKP